jgi:hypothetical protein
MQTNLRGKIRELFIFYYSTHVIRFSSKSHILEPIYSYSMKYKH